MPNNGQQPTQAPATATEPNYTVHRGTRTYAKIWNKGVDIEFEARRQIDNLASLPIIHSHIAIMPDAHWGKGAVVGSVIPTKEAIIPAAVGVDIGCGMMAVKTNLTSHQLPDNLKDVRNKIEELVPVGFNDHGDMEPPEATQMWKVIRHGHFEIEQKHPKLITKKSPVCQMGTLGGGNHFIEICLDENDTVWFMLHSGSRNIGNRIGQYFITKAKEETERLGVKLPDNDLAYLSADTDIFHDYIYAVEWAQTYAKCNRSVMMYLVKAAVSLSLGMTVKADQTNPELAVNCHHNYVEKEHHFGEDVWLTRKGAVSARQGQLGIIPGSMGAKSYIVEGLGNPDSFHTCSHGAGRIMSRGAAKRLISLEDHIKDTQGIECRKDIGVIDESPRAYKDIDAVMEAQKDLVKIRHTLKQVLCVKG